MARKTLEIDGKEFQNVIGIKATDSNGSIITYVCNDPQQISIEDIPNSTGMSCIINGIDSQNLPNEDDEVCFWDYDGTLVYSCSLAEAKTFTSMPNLPDHSSDIVPLTGLGWNWSLAELKSAEYPADIGAIYTPTDGKTHFFIELDQKTGLTFSVAVYENATITWGDGTSSSGDSTSIYTHTYSNYGKYHLTVTNVLYRHSNNGDGDNIFNPKEAVTDTLYLSKNINHNWINTWNGALLGGTKVKYIVVPYSTRLSGISPFTNASLLEHLNLNFVPDWELKNLYNLKYVSLPYGTNNLNADYVFNTCPSLRRLRFQLSLSGNRGAISSCTSLKEIGGSGYLSIGGALSTLANLYSLKSFKIHPNCTAIDGTTFLQNAYSLTDLYVYPETPPTLSSASIHQHDFLRIHVPSASLTAYQSATNWSTYASYIVGDL